MPLARFALVVFTVLIVAQSPANFCNATKHMMLLIVPAFLLSEEPMRGVGGTALGAGAEYVATVRCVNPSPLAERRVSASDAHPPADPDTTARYLLIAIRI